jgi:hypothetical protein
MLAPNPCSAERDAPLLFSVNYLVIMHRSESPCGPVRQCGSFPMLFIKPLDNSIV